MTAAGVEQVTDVQAIQSERIGWQNSHAQRFLELPQVDPRLHVVSFA